jgi:hypothetical protein
MFFIGDHYGRIELSKETLNVAVIWVPLGLVYAYATYRAHPLTWFITGSEPQSAGAWAGAIGNQAATPSKN